MIISALKALYDRSRKNDNIDVVLLGIAKKINTSRNHHTEALGRGDPLHHYRSHEGA